eukprot:6463631-Amphidinium_carterae.1
MTRTVAKATRVASSRHSKAAHTSRAIADIAGNGGTSKETADRRNEFSLWRRKRPLMLEVKALLA